MPPNPYTAVFESLVNAETGQPAAKDIIYSYIKNPKTIFYVVGQPAVGKTTAISQFLNILQSTAEGYKADVTIKTVFFDKVQSKTEAKIRKTNPKKINSTKWGKNDWKIFENELQEQIQNPETYKRGKLNRLRTTFLTIETPFIFYWERENNGFKILKNIIQKNKNFTIVYLVSDEEIVEKNLKMRSFILNNRKYKKSPDFAKIIESDFKTIISDQKGRLLDINDLEQIVARMAPKEAIESVKTMMDEKIKNWCKEKEIYNKYKKMVKLPSDYGKLPKHKKTLYLNEAAYALFLLRKKFGLPKSRSIVAFNPILKNQKTYVNLKMLQM